MSYKTEREQEYNRAFQLLSELEEALKGLYLINRRGNYYCTSDSLQDIRFKLERSMDNWKREYRETELASGNCKKCSFFIKNLENTSAGSEYIGVCSKTDRRTLTESICNEYQPIDTPPEVISQEPTEIPTRKTKKRKYNKDEDAEVPF